LPRATGTGLKREGRKEGECCALRRTWTARRRLRAVKAGRLQRTGLGVKGRQKEGGGRVEEGKDKIGRRDLNALKTL